MLPVNVCNKDEAAEASRSLAAALQGRLPQDATQRTQLPKNAFAFREFRKPTKDLLAGIANSLQQAMPSGFTLQSCKPPNPLKPAGQGCERHVYDNSELRLLPQQLPSDAHFFFTWDSEALESRKDFYEHENFTRLVFSADEGTQACLAEVYEAPNTKSP